MLSQKWMPTMNLSTLAETWLFSSKASTRHLEPLKANLAHLKIIDTAFLQVQKVAYSKWKMNVKVADLISLHLLDSNHSHVNRRGSTSDSLLNFSNRSTLNKAPEGKCKLKTWIKKLVINLAFLNI